MCGDGRAREEGVIVADGLGPMMVAKGMYSGSLLVEAFDQALSSFYILASDTI